MPSPGQKKTKASKKPSITAIKAGDADELEEWKRSKQLLKPKDQLELSEPELKDIQGRSLVTDDPQPPDNLVQFDYNESAFIPIPIPPPPLIVYQNQGTQFHKESEEAKQQYIEMGLDPALLLEGLVEDTGEPAAAIEAIVAQDEEGDEDEEEEEENEEMADEQEGKPEKTEEKPEEPQPDDEVDDEGEEGGTPKTPKKKAAATPGRKKKLTNQFNFCDRAALTYNNPKRSQETQTIPPSLSTLSANVLQWIIYDAMQLDYEEQQKEKEIERLKLESTRIPIAKHQTTTKRTTSRVEINEIVQARMNDAWKILERMVNQNSYDEIAKDYRYWDDPSDEFREGEGTLLPLWKFSYDKTRRHTVTDLAWNPYYYDLFAVCYGFMDYTKPINEGTLCLYTLKNPSYPVYVRVLDSAVMCVHTHPKIPYMIVTGQFDGMVNVFNMQLTSKEPIYQCSGVVNKHRGMVWEVSWAPDLPDGELNFYSIGIDGKVNNWVLMQNELVATTVITLLFGGEDLQGLEGSNLRIQGCASCFKFHPTDPLIYLVGTEEGIIYKCSTFYSSSYLLKYEAHQLPVHRVSYNKFNSAIFISCGADWRIKIWEDGKLDPLFVFDVGSSVGDIKWAPYSSTVFAAVTSEGKVYIFDLNVNKYKPICVQAIVSKKTGKLTRIQFNKRMPIIIVGDDKGCVGTLKLSPNLRIMCKPPKKQQHLDQRTLQIMKLDAILALVREPAIVTRPADVEVTED